MKSLLTLITSGGAITASETVNAIHLDGTLTETILKCITQVVILVSAIYTHRKLSKKQ